MSIAFNQSYKKTDTISSIIIIPYYINVQITNTSWLVHEIKVSHG